MARKTVTDLIAFLAVARELSFTRAAAQLGVSQPALSRTVSELEARLGVRLLTRSTRSVALTEAGEGLVQTVGPHFEGIDAGLAALTAMREKPAGNLRITSVEHASDTILGPAVAQLLKDYPDIRVEVINDYSRADLVAERYDAGVRLGEHVAKDMIALRIGPDFRQALVGAPSYFARRPRPDTPHDLTAHACINLRLGLAYLPEDVVQQQVTAGRLVRVLEDWSPVITGYHLYYPSRQPSPAFAKLVEALRYRS